MLSAEQIEVVVGLVARARHTYPEDVRPSRAGYQFALARANGSLGCTIRLPVNDPRTDDDVPVSIELQVGRGGDCDDRFLTSVERAVAQAALPAARAA